MSKKKASIIGGILFVVLAFGSTTSFMDEEPKEKNEINKLTETNEEKAKSNAAAEEDKKKAEAEAEKQRLAEEEKKKAEEQENQRLAEEAAEKQRLTEENARKQAEEEAEKRQAQQQTQAAPSQKFKNCTEMRKVYPNGVDSSHPAYESKHDRDKDNWACEQ